MESPTERNNTSKWSKAWKPVVASVLAVATLGTGAVAAYAAGEGDHGDGAGGEAVPMSIMWEYKDDASGSFGSAADPQSVVNAFNAAGITIKNGGMDRIRTTLERARVKCATGFMARHPNQGDGECRVVAVGAPIHAGKRSWDENLAWTPRDDWKNAWDTLVKPNKYNYGGLRPYMTSQPFDDDPGRSVDSIAYEQMPDSTGKDKRNLIIIVLDKNQPAPPNYRLHVETDRAAASQYKVGDTNPVADTIHTKPVSPQNGNEQMDVKPENINATVWLNVDTDDKFYLTKPQAVSKQVTLPNNGTTKSPDFTPADFGWKTWQKGTYWFDIDVPKQGNMDSAVNTNDRDGREMFDVVEEPPTELTKTIDKPVSASRMTNTTRITTGTGRGGYQMTITDHINPNGIDYSISNMKVTDLTDKKDVTSQYQTTWDKNANTVTAVYNPNNGTLPFKETDMLPLNHKIEFSFGVTVDKPSDFKQVKDTADRTWNHEPAVSTDEKRFDTWQPKPDKSWIRFDKASGKWQAVIDPEHSNATGADTMTFLDGDKVGSVVNGTIGKNLIAAPESLTLTDDYKNADYVWDTVKDVKQMRVYEADADTDRKSSVADIINTGKDVTSEWNITVKGTVVTATAKASYLKGLKGLTKAKQITLFIPGTINLANGKGAAQARKDFGKQPGDELTTCVNPNTGSDVNGGKLSNSGAEQLNNHNVATNEPHICVYTPPVKKKIIAESSQGGDQANIELKTVYPGQKVEYQLVTQPKLPNNLGYTIEKVGVTDTYDPFLTPDKQTVEVTDLNTATMIAKTRYTTKWDDKNHQFQLTFDSKFAQEQWKNGQNPRLLVRFEGTVRKDAPTTKTVDNEWKLTLNNSITPSNIVKVEPPELEPHKQDKSIKNKSVNIDGKTLLVGEQGLYQLSLDATDNNNAYKVWRLGMTDDFDEKYVKINPQDITVLSDTGKDVTGKFNVQVKNGVAYIYAKTVDTLIPATGENAKGDPQPSDLAAYSKLDRKYNPLKDPSIDQTLLGHRYTIELPYTVIAGGNNTVVKNTALQVTNDLKKQTETVKNPIKEINPDKDVTIKVNGESKDTQAIYLNSDFLYQLDSSTIPTNRAYPQVAKWGIDDQLDPTVDQLSGQWAVYANADLYKDGKKVAAKGDKLDGSKFKSTLGELFTAKLDPKTGAVSIQATAAYLKMVSADTVHEQAWRAYIQVKRIAIVEHHENQFVEHFDDKNLESNIVWTYTPDLTPSLHVEKYDVETGEVLGDRDDVKDALQIHGDWVEIGFKITNTSKTDPRTGKGATFTGKNLKLTDKTIAGVGTVEDFKYPDGWDTLVLKPGESTVVTGTLKGVNAGDKHTDRVQVTGKPNVVCPVTDPDPFNTNTGKTGETSEDGGMTTECDAPEVTSNTDDWSGYKLTLAETGAQTATMLMVAAGSLLAGALGLHTVRRRNRARHIA
ncbi:hypothetical protein GCM10007377_15190 [Galliscardovia ingluviei]|uniref:Uncharacterized protein n=1 Tax=Galliscardovia ingluviei TaxID=1769422 RepID=A0A8J3ARJ1_9BIFI|nr:LPXTG cell wall anchor domain-containing protein [Galliscardovia ingluviei]GGI15296.1 hypothetical protein GCM10007377_15190 [Galliscardovia ingluviei]